MFNLLIDKLKDVTAQSIRDFAATHGMQMTIIAAKYRTMLEDEIMGVSRMYPHSLKKLPFIIVGTVSGAESLIGFGRNRIKVDGEIVIESLTGPFNIGRRWFLKIEHEGRVYEFDAYGELFSDSTSVTAQEVASVIKLQMPPGWTVQAIDGKVRIRIDSFKSVKVIEESGQLGFSTGVHKPLDYRLVDGVGEGLSISIDIGTESEQTRAQIVDLMMFWINRIRMEEIWLEDEQKTISAFLSGTARVTGEGEISFGEGDRMFLLYTNRIDIPVMLYSYDAGRSLPEQLIIRPIGG